MLPKKRNPQHTKNEDCAYYMLFGCCCQYGLRSKRFLMGERAYVIAATKRNTREAMGLSAAAAWGRWAGEANCLLFGR